MAKNKFLNKINQLLEKITEEVPEITDNGLNEDAVKPTQKTIVEKMATPQKERKLPSTSNEDTVRVVKNTSDSNLSQLLTTIEGETTTKTMSEQAQPVMHEVNNSIEESISNEYDMEASLRARDEYIEGFSDACYDVVEKIQSNSVLSRERKVQKIQNIENEYKSIADNDFDALCIFFKKVKHELHMIDNNVGEYDVRVYENNLISNPKVANYRIMDLHVDDELYKYLAKSDMDKVESLLDMCEEIHRRAERCGSLDKYRSLTQQRLRPANTYLDLLVAEEKFDSMLIDLNVLIQTSMTSNNRLA